MATQRPHVLYVKDGKALTAAHKRPLQVDFDLEVAPSGQAAIDKLRVRDFDVLITDLTMPDMDNFEFLEQLRTQRERVATIVLFESLDNPKAIRAEEYGAFCLGKPIKPRVLATAVTKLLKRLASVEAAGVFLGGALAGPVAGTVIQTVTATVAKNEFASIFDSAQKGHVLITKFQKPRAVMLSYEDYQKLLGAKAPVLDELTAEFDELVAQMQTPQAHAGANSLFSMSSEELGEAAVEAATTLTQGDDA